MSSYVSRLREKAKNKLRMARSSSSDAASSAAPDGEAVERGGVEGEGLGVAAAAAAEGEGQVEGEKAENEKSDSKRDLVKGMFMDGLLKGKLALQHELGLGHRPNAIPAGEANINGPHRTVRVGWHPVAGLAGKWFAEQTGLGKMITERINKYPDPTQHWAVLVDDFCHELWMDERLDVIYINEKIVPEEWHTFEVGKTRFNDEALRQAGEMVIHNMRQKQPGYNLISNNCQNFALFMLDAIQVGAHHQFATTFAVYQRATGKGAIKDLFEEDAAMEEADQKPPDGPHQEVVHHAAQVMDENTTKLDNHASF